MLRRILHTLTLFFLLLAVWCAFSGIFTPLLLSMAVICCALITLITLRMEVIDREGHPFELIYLGPVYWCWLAKEMLISGLQVTRIVWSLEPSAESQFAWVKIHLSSDLGRAVFANSLTLTPGTVCVDLENDRAYIHALDKSSLEDMGLAEIEKRVERITAFAASGGSS